jgi:hypothetical protein
MERLELEPELTRLPVESYLLCLSIHIPNPLSGYLQVFSGTSIGYVPIRLFGTLYLICNTQI